jgi:hypothetical protein
MDCIVGETLKGLLHSDSVHSAPVGYQIGLVLIIFFVEREKIIHKGHGSVDLRHHARHLCKELLLIELGSGEDGPRDSTTEAVQSSEEKWVAVGARVALEIVLLDPTAFEVIKSAAHDVEGTEAVVVSEETGQM